MVEIIENQLHGTSAISLPGKIGNARGALKVDGLDQFNPSANLKLEGKKDKKGRKDGKKTSCC